MIEILNASYKGIEKDKVAKEEKAAMYLLWIVMPSSAQICRNLRTKMLDARFEAKKILRQINKLSNTLDIRMVSETEIDSERAEIYDKIAKSFRESAYSEEQSIKECLQEHYFNSAARDTLCDIAFAYTIVNVHKSVIELLEERLARVRSGISFKRAAKSLGMLSKSLAKLGEIYEKKNRISLTAYHSVEDVVGLADTIGEYYKILLSNEQAHGKIHGLFRDYDEEKRKEIEDYGKTLECAEISELGIECDFIQRNNIQHISDLYRNGKFKDFDWSEDEKEQVIKALQRYVKQRVFGYV